MEKYSEINKFKINSRLDIRNMKNTTLIGNIGEQLACDYLTDKGYRILERNAKICGAEIDIICEAPCYDPFQSNP